MKVLITTDEIYTDIIYEFEEVERGEPPALYMPVEIPDGLYRAYDNAYKAWVAIRCHIVDQYGVSQINPDYADQSDAYWAERRSAAVQADADDDVEAVWAEFFNDDR